MRRLFTSLALSRERPVGLTLSRICSVRFIGSGVDGMTSGQGFLDMDASDSLDWDIGGTFTIGLNVEGELSAEIDTEGGGLIAADRFFVGGFARGAARFDEFNNAERASQISATLSGRPARTKRRSHESIFGECRQWIASGPKGSKSHFGTLASIPGRDSGTKE